MERRDFANIHEKIFGDSQNLEHCLSDPLLLCVHLNPVVSVISKASVLTKS